MKNNKIFNRTFKVSLVAAALGLVNSALAANVACNSGGVTITGQSGTVLNQCSINPTSPTNDPVWGSDNICIRKKKKFGGRKLAGAPVCGALAFLGRKFMQKWKMVGIGGK